MNKDGESSFVTFLERYRKEELRSIAEKENFKELFLTLWDNAVESPDYDKPKWKEMRGILIEMGIEL